jgi:hypothetical protein
MSKRTHPVDLSGMDTAGAGAGGRAHNPIASRFVFLAWAFVAAPAIGYAVAWIFDAEEWALLALVTALPSGVAVVGGLALRQDRRFMIVVALLAALVGGTAMMIILVLTRS